MQQKEQVKWHFVQHIKYDYLFSQNQIDKKKGCNFQVKVKDTLPLENMSSDPHNSSCLIPEK